MKVEPARVDSLVDQTVEKLRAAGKRMTAPRRMLLECLFDGASHRTAEDLSASLQRVMPEISVSTVYRNLEELERLGVVEHVHLGHGPATYHLAGERHSHFVCEECGAVFEAPDELFAELEHRALALAGIRITPHHFAILGTCAGCEVGA